MSNDSIEYLRRRIEVSMAELPLFYVPDCAVVGARLTSNVAYWPWEPAADEIEIRAILAKRIELFRQHGLRIVSELAIADRHAGPIYFVYHPDHLVPILRPAWRAITYPDLIERVNLEDYEYILHVRAKLRHPPYYHGDIHELRHMLISNTSIGEAFLSREMPGFDRLNSSHRKLLTEIRPSVLSAGSNSKKPKTSTSMMNQRKHRLKPARLMGPKRTTNVDACKRTRHNTPPLPDPLPMDLDPIDNKWITVREGSPDTSEASTRREGTPESVVSSGTLRAPEDSYMEPLEVANLRENLAAASGADVDGDDEDVVIGNGLVYVDEGRIVEVDGSDSESEDNNDDEHDKPAPVAALDDEEEAINDGGWEVQEAADAPGEDDQEDDENSLTDGEEPETPEGYEGEDEYEDDVEEEPAADVGEGWAEYDDFEEGLGN